MKMKNETHFKCEEKQNRREKNTCIEKIILFFWLPTRILMKNRILFKWWLENDDDEDE